MKVSTLKSNKSNPRQIKGEKLELLKKSVASFQKMMLLRPIVIDENNVVLGGNMRLAAIKALGLKDIPDEWVTRAELTDDEKREFIIKDNVGFGENDWDLLANEWSDCPLTEWGVEIPVFDDTTAVPAESDWMTAFEGGTPRGSLETVNMTFVLPLSSAERVKKALEAHGKDKNSALVAMAERCLD